MGEENIIIRVPTSALVQFLETLGNRRSLRSKTECQGPRWHQGNCSPPASGLLHRRTHIKCSASAPQQLARTPVHGRAILEERTFNCMCVGDAVGTAWPGCVGTHLHLVCPIPRSAEGEMAGRDMPYKLEPADVMTLLARRHDRIIRPLSCVPE